jgi:CRP-like cAMP-binding protein
MEIMTQEDLIPFLKRTELFVDFSQDELKEVLPFIRMNVFSKDDWIFREKDPSRELFILKTGKAAILKEEKESEQFQRLKTLQRGDYFGEMAHLENEMRSASAQSLEQSEILSIDLDRLKKSNLEKIYFKVIAALAKKVSHHLREADDSLIESLRQKIAIMRSHAQISKTLLFIFVLMAIWFNVAKLVDTFYTRKDLIDPIFTSGLLLLFVIPCAYVVKSSTYPLKFYGLTWERWFHYSIDACLYSIPIILVITLLKWVLISRVAEFQGIPFFSWQHLVENYRSILIFGGAYILLIPAQEFIVRGILQSCFRNFFHGTSRIFLAILSSNLIFQMLHTVKGFWLAFFSFFLGLFWGAIFEQQRSLVGVCVSHALIGFVILFVLDFQTVMQIADSMQATQVVKTITSLWHNF